jgi:hypothetical protein
VDGVADAHAAGAVEPSDAAQQSDALGLGPAGLASVVVAGDHEVAPRERRRRVDSPGDGLARSPAPRERLGRDAAPVGALAAELLALDDRDPQAALGQPGGAVLAGRAAADDDDVEVGAHARPRALSISYAAVISPTWL